MYDLSKIDDLVGKCVKYLQFSDRNIHHTTAGITALIINMKMDQNRL